MFRPTFAIIRFYPKDLYAAPVKSYFLGADS